MRQEQRGGVEQLALSRLYSEELGIDLQGGSDDEIFKWFLASLLFGARISETIAEKTYRTLERYRLLTPEAIVEAGWDFLVDPVMREGGYVRYDGKTSDKLLDDCRMLQRSYGGSLNRLHAFAEDGSDLERRLLLFRGVGPVTVNIFLRELRPVWPKADPEPLPIVAEIARGIGVDLAAFDRKGMAFVRIEAGVMRMRRQWKAAAPR